MDSLTAFRFIDSALHPDSPFMKMHMTPDNPPTPDPRAKDLVALSMQHYGACKTLHIRISREVSDEAIHLTMAPIFDAMAKSDSNFKRDEAIKRYKDKATENAFTIELTYEAPNRFLVLTHINARHNSRVVCDGHRYHEHSTFPKILPVTDKAPPTIAEAQFITKDMLGGSPLWSFLGGNNQYSRLIDDTRIPLGFYATQIPISNGHAQMVGFFSPVKWGHVRMLVGDPTGLVHWLTYDVSPSKLQATNSVGQSFTDDMPGPLKEIAGGILRGLMPAGLTSTLDTIHNSANQMVHAGAKAIDPIYGPPLQPRFRVELLSVNQPVDPSLFTVPA